MNNMYRAADALRPEDLVWVSPWPFLILFMAIAVPGIVLLVYTAPVAATLRTRPPRTILKLSPKTGMATAIVLLLAAAGASTSLALQHSAETRRADQANSRAVAAWVESQGLTIDPEDAEDLANTLLRGFRTTHLVKGAEGLLEVGAREVDGEYVLMHGGSEYVPSGTGK